MANIAAVLKDEITRLARKELRVETEKLKKASAQYRSDIAALKRRMVQLEKEVAQHRRATTKTAKPPGNPDLTGSVRFSAKGLRTLRERLDLSAAALGQLFGLTAQTVYNWERGKTRPSKEQIAAIAALRAMSKKEVGTLLAERA